MNLPSPIGLKFTDSASIAVEQFGYAPTPPIESQWREWAASLSGTTPGTVIPSPYGFSGWQSWASALIGSIS